MIARTLDREVGRRLARPVCLRPYARVSGLQCAVPEPGIVTADRFVESFFTRLIEPIIDAIDPRKIRPEFDLAAEIDRDMHAQPVLARHRVDQAIER